MAMSTKGIVGIGVGFFVLSAILPAAFDAIFNANQTNWDAGTIALWALIPLIAVVVVILRLQGGRE